MESNKFLRKCGEILLDIKSKKKKNKIYIFQCTFCDIQCDQLKKFSLHIGEEHLNDFDEILNEAQNLNEPEIVKETEFLNETELKFEAEPEEYKISSFNETPDVKVFPRPIETKTNTNPDPLDTVTAASSSTNTENLNCEVKYEIIEHEDEGAGEIRDGTVSISDSDKSDSDEDYIDEVPHKKRKRNQNAKKGKQKKRKENSNDTESDESKDAECNETPCPNPDNNPNIGDAAKSDNRKLICEFCKAVTFSSRYNMIKHYLEAHNMITQDIKNLRAYNSKKIFLSRKASEDKSNRKDSGSTKNLNKGDNKKLYCEICKIITFSNMCNKRRHYLRVHDIVYKGQPTNNDKFKNKIKRLNLVENSTSIKKENAAGNAGNDQEPNDEEDPISNNIPKLKQYMLEKTNYDMRISGPTKDLNAGGDPICNNIPKKTQQNILENMAKDENNENACPRKDKVSNDRKSAVFDEVRSEKGDRSSKIAIELNEIRESMTLSTITDKIRNYLRTHNIAHKGKNTNNGKVNKTVTIRIKSLNGGEESIVIKKQYAAHKTTSDNLNYEVTDARTEKEPNNKENLVSNKIPKNKQYVMENTTNDKSDKIILSSTKDLNEGVNPISNNIPKKKQYVLENTTNDKSNKRISSATKDLNEGLDLISNNIPEKKQYVLENTINDKSDKIILSSTKDVNVGVVSISNIIPKKKQYILENTTNDKSGKGISSATKDLNEVEDPISNNIPKKTQNILENMAKDKNNGNACPRKDKESNDGKGAVFDVVRSEKEDRSSRIDTEPNDIRKSMTLSTITDKIRNYLRINNVACNGKETNNDKVNKRVIIRIKRVAGGEDTTVITKQYVTQKTTSGKVNYKVTHPQTDKEPNNEENLVSNNILKNKQYVVENTTNYKSNKRIFSSTKDRNEGEDPISNNIPKKTQNVLENRTKDKTKETVCPRTDKDWNDGAVAVSDKEGSKEEVTSSIIDTEPNENRKTMTPSTISNNIRNYYKGKETNNDKVNKKRVIIRIKRMAGGEDTTAITKHVAQKTTSDNLNYEETDAQTDKEANNEKNLVSNNIPKKTQYFLENITNDKSEKRISSSTKDLNEGEDPISNNTKDKNKENICPRREKGSNDALSTVSDKQESQKDITNASTDRETHGNKEPFSGTHELICEICKIATFANISNKRKHYWVVHEIVYEGSQSSTTETKSNKENLNPNKHQIESNPKRPNKLYCEICKIATFSTMSNKRRHYWSIHKTPYQDKEINSKKLKKKKAMPTKRLNGDENSKENNKENIYPTTDKESNDAVVVVSDKPESQKNASNATTDKELNDKKTPDFYNSNKLFCEICKIVTFSTMSNKRRHYMRIHKTPYQKKEINSKKLKKKKAMATKRLNGVENSKENNKENIYPTTDKESNDAVVVVSDKQESQKNASSATTDKELNDEETSNFYDNDKLFCEICKIITFSSMSNKRRHYMRIHKTAYKGK